MSSGPCETYKDLDARLKKFPLMQYAARYWGKHASTGGVERILQGPICQVLWRWFSHMVDTVTAILLALVSVQMSPTLI